jgi:hypothetical protein
MAGAAAGPRPFSCFSSSRAEEPHIEVDVLRPRAF